MKIYTTHFIRTLCRASNPHVSDDIPFKGKYFLHREDAELYVNSDEFKNSLHEYESLELANGYANRIVFTGITEIDVIEQLDMKTLIELGDAKRAQEIASEIDNDIFEKIDREYLNYIQENT